MTGLLESGKAGGATALAGGATALAGGARYGDRGYFVEPPC